MIAVVVEVKKTTKAAVVTRRIGNEDDAKRKRNTKRNIARKRHVKVEKMTRPRTTRGGESDERKKTDDDRRVDTSRLPGNDTGMMLMTDLCVLLLPLPPEEVIENIVVKGTISAKLKIEISWGIQ